MIRGSAAWLCATVFAGLIAPAVAQLPDGAATIRGKVGESEIVLTTTPRLAGAIHSLFWNGREFIDSADHGRQLQSASNFDAGSPIAAETYNPTEAGSRRDGAGEKSSSRLLHLVARDNVLQTTTQMAFWLAPSEASGGVPAKNRTVLSNHLLTKRVTIGTKTLPQVVQYDVTFSLPVGERHQHAVFEAVTGYMPAEFSRFWRFNPADDKLEPLTDGPGEQPLPVVLATESGSHAMGCYAPAKLNPEAGSPGYGRFRFEREKVVKWNCVFRARDPAGLAARDYVFRQFVIVGDLEMVRSALAELHREHR